MEHIRDKLVPVLGNFWRKEQRSVVIMDNCSIHMDPRVKELIEGAGAVIIYSAPYSPELIPIEYMFSTWKAYLKRHHLAFTRDWYTVHMSALASFTPQQGLHFFRKTTLVNLVRNHPLSEEHAQEAAEALAVVLVLDELNLI